MHLLQVFSRSISNEITLILFLCISSLSVRDAKHTNFVEFRNFKIIYRRYAGLYFCICVDVTDNNLFYLEAIHNFVEVISMAFWNMHFNSVILILYQKVLNEYFHNVCELDLVFNFYKVICLRLKTGFEFC